MFDKLKKWLTSVETTSNIQLEIPTERKVIVVKKASKKSPAKKKAPAKKKPAVKKSTKKSTKKK